jgi:hypothetical protein
MRIRADTMTLACQPRVAVLARQQAGIAAKMERHLGRDHAIGGGGQTNGMDRLLHRLT